MNAFVEYLPRRNASATPPKVELKMMKGMGLAMTKLMLGGKMEEAIETVRSNYKHIEDLI